MRFAIIAAVALAAGTPDTIPLPLTASAKLQAQTGAESGDVKFTRFMRSAQKFARDHGYTAAFPDFKCSSKREGDWERWSCGIVLLSAVVAEEVWVTDEQLGITSTGSVSPGELFTRAADYAAALVGYVGAYPSMAFVSPTLGDAPVRRWQLILIREHGGAEWRDVPARELGTSSATNWQLRTQQANTWARARGFAGALQTFHEADYGAGLVYGTHLFGGPAALVTTVPGIVFDIKDKPLTHATPPSQGEQSVQLFGDRSPRPPIGTFVGDSQAPGGCGTRRITRITRSISEYDQVNNAAMAVTYLDCTGAQRQATLRFGEWSTAFRGMDVGGKWEARLVGTIILPGARKIPELPMGLQVKWESVVIDPITLPQGSAATVPQPPAEPYSFLDYRIIPVASQSVPGSDRHIQALQIQGASCSPAASVTHAPPSTAAQQLFRFLKNADGTFTIRSSLTGQDWDVEGASTAPGTRLQQYPTLNAPNQRFRVSRTPTGGFGFRIRPVHAPEQSITAADGVPAIDALVVLAPIRTTPADLQTYRLEASFVLPAENPAPGLWCEPRTPTPAHPITRGWQQIDGNPATVALAADARTGDLYQLHAAGGIFRYSGTPYKWEPIDANPATVAIAAGGGNIVQRHNNGDVFLYTGTPFHWEHIDANPAISDVVIDGLTGAIYQRRSNGHIFRYMGSPWSWERVDANGATAAIAAGGGSLIQMHGNGNVFRYSGTPYRWEQIGSSGETRRIAMDATTGDVYQIRANGHIFRYGGAGVWHRIDANGTSIGVTASHGRLFQLHSTGWLFEYAGPYDWRALDQNPGTVGIVVANGTVVQRQHGGAIWRYTGW